MIVSIYLSIYVSTYILEVYVTVIAMLMLESTYKVEVLLLQLWLIIV